MVYSYFRSSEKIHGNNYRAKAWLRVFHGFLIGPLYHYFCLLVRPIKEEEDENDDEGRPVLENNEEKDNDNEEALKEITHIRAIEAATESAPQVRSL